VRVAGQGEAGVARLGGERVAERRTVAAGAIERRDQRAHLRQRRAGGHARQGALERDTDGDLTSNRTPFRGERTVRAGSDGGGDPLGDRGFPAQFFDYYRLAAHNAGDLTRAVVAELARLASDDTARRTCRLLARARWKAAASRIAAQ